MPMEIQKLKMQIKDMGWQNEKDKQKNKDREQKKLVGREGRQEGRKKKHRLVLQ